MEERLPYLAGFIDGEGSVAVGISKNPKGERRWYLRFSAHQINPAPLFLLQEQFGGSVRRTVKPGFRTIHEWVVQSMLAYEALVALRPYLIVKADEADVGIEFQRLLMARGTRRSVLTDEEIKARNDLYLRLRALKDADYEEAVAPKVPRIKAPKPPKRVHVKAEPVHSTGYDRGKRPARDELAFSYTATGLNATARRYGVSRQTVYNWLDRYDIPRMGRTEESEMRRIAALRR